jgi:hypothetical protein
MAERSFRKAKTEVRFLSSAHKDYGLRLNRSLSIKTAEVLLGDSGRNG